MKKDSDEEKSHVCRFCKQSFSNGRKLGGHMRGHLALISASRKKTTQAVINGEKGSDVFDDDGQIVIKLQGSDQDYDVNNSRKKGVQVQENYQEIRNGEKGIDFDDQEEDEDEMIKKSQQEMDVDQDYGANVYVLRENPKRSWRVSNPSKDYGSNLCKECGKRFHSSKALAAHKKCHSRKESIKKTVCEKCGKGFDSVKALYGHMRCHSIKRSRPLDEPVSSQLSSSEERDDGGAAAASQVRKKRSCTRYKSPKPNHVCTGLSSFDDDDGDVEVEEGAMCLMMLSRGVRNLDGVKLVILNRAEIAFSDSGYSRSPENSAEIEVSVDGSMEFCKLKNNNTEVGLKKDLISESGLGQMNLVRMGSTLMKCQSTKKPRSCDQDFVDRDDTDSEISLDMKRRSKDHNCPICFKEFESDEAMDHHKRVHKKTECQAVKPNDFPNVHRLVDLNLEGGNKNDDVEFKLTWVQSDIEWDPLMMVS